MTHTSRLSFVASVCVFTVLYGGYAFALPHSGDYKADKTGKGGWSHGSYNDWDDDHWHKKKDKLHKYEKYGWEGHGTQTDWLTWGDEKQGQKSWYGGKDWGKDLDCDPPMTHTPEPGTLLLLGSSLAAASAAWRRSRGAQ